MKKIRKSVVLIIKKFIKGFSLIELLVVIAIIAILAAIIFIVLSGSKDKANTAAVKQTAESVVHQIEVTALDGGGVVAPINNSSGGGPICSSPCSHTETWPSIQKTGYKYVATTDTDVSDGNYSFTIEKIDKPAISVEVVNGVAKVTEVPVVLGGGGGGGGGSGVIVKKSLSGYITYANSSSSPMNNTTVSLMQNGATSYTTTTDSNGYYNLPEVLQGTYNVYFSKSGSVADYSKISGIDGLYIKIFVGDNSLVTGISILASDVYENSPNSIITAYNDNYTPADSFLVQQYVIGTISSFPTGKWVFTKSDNINTPYSSFPIQFATSGGFSNISITIGDANIVQNFSSRAFGDVTGA